MQFNLVTGDWLGAVVAATGIIGLDWAPTLFEALLLLLLPLVPPLLLPWCQHQLTLNPNRFMYWLLQLVARSSCRLSLLFYMSNIIIHQHHSS